MAAMPKPPTDKEIIDAVKAGYEQKYPDMTQFKVQRIIRNVLGGIFVQTKYTRTTREYVDDHDELCFVLDKRPLVPEIFSSDEGLSLVMERQAERTKIRQSQIEWLDKLFSQRIIGGLIFVIVMIALIVAMFLSPRNPDVLAIIGGIAGAAAGVFYGTSGHPPPLHPGTSEPVSPTHPATSNSPVEPLG
jgi:hypothetical protein